MIVQPRGSQELRFSGIAVFRVHDLKPENMAMCQYIRPGCPYSSPGPGASRQERSMSTFTGFEDVVNSCLKFCLVRQHRIPPLVDLLPVVKRD